MNVHDAAEGFQYERRQEMKQQRAPDDCVGKASSAVPFKQLVHRISIGATWMVESVLDLQHSKCSVSPMPCDLVYGMPGMCFLWQHGAMGSQAAGRLQLAAALPRAAPSLLDPGLSCALHTTQCTGFWLDWTPVKMSSVSVQITQRDPCSIDMKTA